MLESIVIVVDLETTGVDPTTCGIVQIGAVTYHPEREHYAVALNQLVDPGMPIPAEASAIHGITDEHIRYAPAQRTAIRLLENSIYMIARVAERVPIVAGFNCASYDFKVLEANGMELVRERTLDVRWLTDRYYPYNGGTLSATYQVATGNPPLDAHDAVADCIMTTEILHTHLQATGKTVDDLLEEFKTPQVLEFCALKKHAGKPWKDVPKAYVRWCLDNFTDLSPDLALTLRTYA